MPAYFEMSLLFQRKELYSGFIAGFDAALDRAGLRFKAGFWSGEGCTQDEIAVWNQQKLEADFTLGHTQHYTHDYKQTLYEWKQYSHVRGFWMNQYPKDGSFVYNIIIPEREALEDGVLRFRTEAAAELMELAQKLWQFPPVRAVQTGLELSDPPLSLAELRKGQSPNACPFVLVEPDCHPFDDGSRVVPLTEGRPGLLLVEDDMLPPAPPVPMWLPPPGRPGRS